MITGESKLIPKHIGDEVIGGSMNSIGSIVIQVSPGFKMLFQLSYLFDADVGAHSVQLPMQITKQSWECRPVLTLQA